MVNLTKPETNVVRAVKVEHLMTEEQATAAAVKTAPVEDKPEVEVLELTPPLLRVLADYNKRLAKAEKEAEHHFRLFMWALFAIYTLCFTFTTILGCVIPHAPEKIVVIRLVQGLFGALLVSSFVGNMINKFAKYRKENK